MAVTKYVGESMHLSMYMLFNREYISDHEFPVAFMFVSHVESITSSRRFKSLIYKTKARVKATLKEKIPTCCR